MSPFISTTVAQETTATAAASASSAAATANTGRLLKIASPSSLNH